MSETATREQILCACYNVTLDRVKAMKKADTSLTFDELMRSTGAGTKCTACLLDLEYFFVSGEVPRDKTNRRKPTPKQSFKRRIYDLIDSYSPKRPTVSRTVAPIVSGPGIEQYFWMANTPMLFDDDEFEATPHRIRYAVRDSSGRVCQQDDIRLGAGESARVNISKCLPSETTGPLAIGTFDISLWSEIRGVRGTTRPQIEILTQTSACSVHTQGPFRTPFEAGMTVPNNPQDDRIFFAFMNPFPTTLTGRINLATGTAPIQVQPHGATLFEMPRSGYRSEGRTTFVSWKLDAGGKVYMLCSSKSLDRFSVDHV